jgi:hypothetical protein
VDGKYGAGHPGGGMIGYVMDGDVPSALEAIKQRISKRRISLRVTPAGDYKPSPMMPMHSQNGETQHQRRDGCFTIYHLLLPLHR